MGGGGIPLRNVNLELGTWIQVLWVDEPGSVQHIKGREPCVFGKKREGKSIVNPYSRKKNKWLFNLFPNINKGRKVISSSPVLWLIIPLSPWLPIHGSSSMLTWRRLLPAAMSRPAARAMHSLQGRQMRVRAAATVTAAVAAMEVVVPVVVRGRRMRPPVSFLLSRAGTPYARASFFHPLSSSSEHSAKPLIDGMANHSSSVWNIPQTFLLLRGESRWARPRFGSSILGHGTPLTPNLVTMGLTLEVSQSLVFYMLVSISRSFLYWSDWSRPSCFNSFSLYCFSKFTEFVNCDRNILLMAQFSRHHNLVVEEISERCSVIDMWISEAHISSTDCCMWMTCSFRQ